VIFGWFGRAFAVFAAYKFGLYCSSVYRQKWKKYLTATGWILILTLFLWGYDGSVPYDEDNPYEVEDFVPSNEERNEHSLAFFLALAIPAVIGVYEGEKRSTGNSNEQKDILDR
jgi:hypothetical protein